MEELREIAKAHYRAGSSKVQGLAYEFYQSMDSDGDGRVNLSEFLAFMTHQGYSHMRNPNFFDQLDLDGNGTLDFWEVMTLYYVIKSGRPFCACCRKFIPGLFFSCVECFKKYPKSSFDLCRDCHRERRFDHNHGGRTQFLDNYTLLQAIRDPPPAQPSPPNLNYQMQASNIPTNAIVPQLYAHNSVSIPHNAMVPASQNQNWAWNRPTNAIVPQPQLYIHNAYPTYNTYVAHPHNNAMVPASPNPNWSKWKAALHAFEIALSIGNVSATLCSIL